MDTTDANWRIRVNLHPMLYVPRMLSARKEEMHYTSPDAHRAMQNTVLACLTRALCVLLHIIVAALLRTDEILMPSIHGQSDAICRWRRSARRGWSHTPPKR